MAELGTITRNEHARPGSAARPAATAGPAPRKHLSGRGQAPTLPATRPRVRGPELIVGVLVVAGCALGAVLWHQSSTSTRQALVLAQAVERGHVFEPADFAAADVSAQGMRLVAFADRDLMVGRIAATDLEAASPVTDSVAVEQVPLGDGESLVGCRLEAGEFPAGLAPGANVRVILVLEHATTPDATPTKESVELPSTAVVESVEPLTNAADAMVATLRLPSELAAQVAAADGVRLVQVGA